MIVTRTPYRMSFVGGGSDMQEFYSRYEGSVVSTTMQQYMYITLHPCFDPTEIKIKYNKTEIVHNVSEIEHPIVRATLRKLRIKGGLEITSVGDIPAQTGLGSSSSFTVGLLRALYMYLGKYRSKEQIANEACQIEIDILKEPIGKQDQYAASYGGLNQFIFKKDGTVESIPIDIEPSKNILLEQTLLLFYTGKTRKSSGVLSEQRKNISTDKKKFQILKEMTEMATPLRLELERGNIESLGEYLHQGWLLKKQLATSISDPDIDKTYMKARKLGAIGGKILGAGGGGFFLFYCPIKNQNALIKGMNMPCLPAHFDFQGSREVYIS